MKFVFPDNLLYQSEFVWVEDCGRGIYRIGITEFGQYLLDDVISVSLPETGIYIEKGEEIISIDAIEDNFVIKSPISGKIVEINESLRHSPELINDSPYDDGWLIEIEIDNSDDLDDLVDSSEVMDLYHERIQQEEYTDEDYGDYDEDYDEYDEDYDDFESEFDDYGDDEYDYDDF